MLKKIYSNFRKVKKHGELLESQLKAARCKQQSFTVFIQSKLKKISKNYYIKAKQFIAKDQKK